MIRKKMVRFVGFLFVLLQGKNLRTSNRRKKIVFFSSSQISIRFTHSFGLSVTIVAVTKVALLF